MAMGSSEFTRRTLLRSSVLGTAAVGLSLAGCAKDQPPPAAPVTDGTPDATPTTTTTPTTQASPRRRQTALVAYFSRPGENYFNGGRRDLEVGNTEVLVGLIDARIDCDVYRIEAADPYPHAYAPTVERNAKEQRDGAHPTIAKPLPDVAAYDTVLLGSPVWNSALPMIMRTFIEGTDLAGKTILPFVTYAVSGLSGIDDDYRDYLPDTKVGVGLAVKGESVADSGTQVDAWLRETSLKS